MVVGGEGPFSSWSRPIGRVAVVRARKPRKKNSLAKVRNVCFFFPLFFYFYSMTIREFFFSALHTSRFALMFPPHPPTSTPLPLQDIL